MRTRVCKCFSSGHHPRKNKPQGNIIMCPFLRWCWKSRASSHGALENAHAHLHTHPTINHAPDHVHILAVVLEVSRELSYPLRPPRHHHLRRANISAVAPKYSHCL